MVGGNGGNGGNGRFGLVWVVGGDALFFLVDFGFG